MAHTINSRLCIAIAAAFVGWVPVPASAQADYPNRAIRIIVPSAPSGGPDVLSRILAEKFTAKWGHPVIVENRPGGSNNIAAQAVANAAPDGHTLLVTPPGPLVTHQNLFVKLGFEPTAFTPVSILVKFPFVRGSLKPANFHAAGTCRLRQGKPGQA
jgi:tripartite-type tricarboxylate transporter receptor subunit TctC